MSKILTLLCTVLFAVQNISAQHNMYVVSKSGKLTAYSVQKVLLHDDIFKFTYNKPRNISMNRFTVSFNVEFKDAAVKGSFGIPEVGVCISSSNDLPTIYDDIIMLGESMTSYKYELSGLEKGTTYFYRAYVKLYDYVYYGDVCQVTTRFGKTETDESKIINGHKFVDLGLPSDLLWAETNIGALSEADAGEYFAWGEVASKSYYSWNTYKYGTSYEELIKYSYSGTEDEIFFNDLDKEDDAAYVNWGDSCRMPTIEDFEELADTSKCTWTLTSKITSVGDTINGYEVISKVNGNSIFFPFTDYRFLSYFPDYPTEGGVYWSSTTDGSAVYTFSFSSVLPLFLGGDPDRWRGYTVRPVAEP